MGQYIQRPDNDVTFRNFFRGIAEALPKLAEMYVQHDVMRDQREYRDKLYNLELSKYEETKANNKANRNLTAEHTTKIKNENTITKGTMKLAIKTQNMQAELTQLMVELESVAKDNPEYRGLYAKASSADLKTKIEGLNELIARIDQTKKEAANTEQYGKIMAVQEQLAKLEVVAKGMAFLTQNMTEEGAIAFMDKYGGQTFGDESQMLQVVLEKGNFSPSLFAHTQTMFDAMMKVRQDESAQIANWDAKHIMPDPEIESNKEAFAQWQADRNQFMGELEQQYGKLHDYFIGKFETMTGE
ncbi:MAG: hypothetical protein U9N86_10155, partial [Bacteroidota bacterium]|nr:hypothetical protein [Bacteroidota bacterium]